MIVEQVDFAITFRRDNSIVLRQGPKLKELADRLKGQIATINAPEQALPDLPRLVVRIPNGLLQVALNRYQLAVKPPDHIASSYTEAMDFAVGVAGPIFTELSKAVKSTFQWSGAVAVMNFPRDRKRFPTGVSAVAPLLQQVTRLDWNPSSLVTFELKIGRQVGKFFHNYSLNGYDIKELHVRASEIRRIQVDSVDFEKARTSETGIAISVDVNSRPSPNKNSPTKDLQAVVAEHRRAVDSLMLDLNLEGAL